MRLLTRHIFRAFPELDHFSDEQCRRFVKAAARGALNRSFRYAMAVLAFLTVGLAILVWVDYLYFRIDFDPYETKSIGISFATTIVPAAVGLLVAFQSALGVRDVLLRRRVRKIVNSRGRCHACKYVLLGLPVGSNLKVRCPECGQDVEVDPSLGELNTGHAGVQEFRPHDDQFDPAAMARLARRRKRIVGWGLSLFVIFVGVPLFAGGVWLLGLHFQAKRAVAARVTYGQLAAVAANVYPVDSKTQSDPASDLPYWIGRQANMTVGVVGREMKDQFGRSGWLDITQFATWSVDPRRLSTHKAETATRQQRERELSRIGASTVIDRLHNLGWMKQVAQLPKMPHAAGLPVQSANQPINRWTLSETGYGMRGVMQVNIARMQFAIEAEDVEEYAAALEQVLAAARIAGRVPTTDCWRDANDIENWAMRMLRNHLSKPLSAEWIARVRKAVADHEPISALPLFDAYILCTKDQVAEFLADPVGVCNFVLQKQPYWGPHMCVLGEIQHVGSLEENLAEIDRLAGEWQTRLELEPWQVREPPSQAAKGLPLIRWAFPFSEKTECDANAQSLIHRGVRVMLAIESFRLRHGRYPAMLDELLSEGVPADQLRDPYSGKNFGYCVTDAAADPLNRGYLLWSVGYDKVDNWGTMHPKGRSSFALDRWNSEGSDYIINSAE